MITSPLPWSIYIKSSGLVNLKDFNGQEIAQFNDYRDADYLLGFCQEQYKELEKEKVGLEHECDTLEYRCGNYKKIIEQLEHDVKVLTKKLTTTTT